MPTQKPRNSNNLAWRAWLASAIGLCLVTPNAYAAGPAQRIQPNLLYHNYCSVCHGDKGDGNSRASNSFKQPPRNFTLAGDSLTREYMINIVTDGKPGTAMVGWKTQLTSNEIAALVDWIRATFMSGKSSPEAVSPHAGISGIQAHGGRGSGPAVTPAADMSLPFLSGLKGNAAAGKVFYDGNCATCHGKQGDGKGPRAYFINPKPRNFLDPAYRGSYNRPVLFAAIAHGRPGTEMPAWNKVISDQEIANVAEYVFQQFIRGK